jgi:hypothetical protein
MSLATERLELSVMAMTDAGRHALSVALAHQSRQTSEPHMAAFYNALLSVCDEAAFRLAVAEQSVRMRPETDPA